MSKETVSQTQIVEEVQVEDQTTEAAVQEKIEYIDEKQLKREHRNELVAKYKPVAKRLGIAAAITVGIGLAVKVFMSLTGANEDGHDDVEVIDGEFTESE